MNLLVKYLLVLTIGVDNQDTTQTNTYRPDTSSRTSKQCVVKQAHINNIAKNVNTKLDSINIKFDQRIKDILKLLEEDNQ